MNIPPIFVENKINFLVFPQTTLADRINDMYFNKKLKLEALPSSNGVWNVAFLHKFGVEVNEVNMEISVKIHFLRMPIFSLIWQTLQFIH